MAGKPLETFDIREQLKQFELTNVKFTGEKLGTGSYGSVDVVEIPGALCAAKTIHELLIQSVSQQRGGHGRGGGYVPRSIIEGFVTECTLMSTLRHPHIVQFLGICYPPGAQLPALVMELLMTSLYNMLESTSDIPLSIKRSLLRDVARGLVFLHSLSLIHRDLTASNVLIDSSLTAKIADLGMARMLNIQAGRREATMTKGPGNASYMPPEAKDGTGDVIKYGKPIDAFSFGNLILFTATQKCPDPKNPTYYDEKSGTMKARTEIERRIDSFQLLWQTFGKEHPLILLATQCLQDNPRFRPTAPQILQRLEAMNVIPYRDWSSSKLELVHSVVSNEQTVSEHQTALVENARLMSEALGENARLVSEHQTALGENARLTSEHQTALGENARLVSEHQRKDQQLNLLRLREKALLAQIEQIKSNKETQAVPGIHPDTSSAMSAPKRQNVSRPSLAMPATLPTPKRQEVSRDVIVTAILAIRVGSGQPLRQVQVPPEVYELAKKFVVKAPNTLGGSEPYRFKILYRMVSGRSIYDLLIADATNIALNNAEAKITGWQEASKVLLRYALNLLLAPKRPEFLRLKLSSSYYVYQVAKKLRGAEEILVSMGYQGVAGSQEVQELTYKDEVNSLLVAEIAADLVILDGELTRVKGLVTFVRSENRAISLKHILQARSHPTEVFMDSINRATRLASPESFPTPPVVHQQSAVPAYNSPQLNQQPRQQLVQYQPLELQHKSKQHSQPHLEPAVRDPRRGSAPGILEQSREGGSHYCNLPLDPDVEMAIRRRQEVKEAGQQQVPNTSSSGHYVNNPNSNSECQRGDQYSEVRYDHEGKVHVEGAQPSIPPDPLNLPEPIVQDEAGLERLQATNPGGVYRTVSLITDARSDPVGFDGPSFDSLISIRSPEHAAQYNKDAWVVDPEPPKYPSAGSSRSWRSHHSNSNTSSGSEDIYGSDNNSAHGSKVPSMESHKQLYQPKDNVSVPRQDATVPESTVPTKRTAKKYDSDYDDYDEVEENISAATRADYVNQVERNKLRTANKYDSDYDDYDEVEENLSAATRADYVNQVERNKSRPSSDYKEYVKRPHGNRFEYGNQVVSTAYSLTPEIETPAHVADTWTCTYCTNIVFNDPLGCDVCGNVKELSTGTGVDLMF